MRPIPTLTLFALLLALGLGACAGPGAEQGTTEPPAAETTPEGGDEADAPEPLTEEGFESGDPGELTVEEDGEGGDGEDG